MLRDRREGGEVEIVDVLGQVRLDADMVRRRFAALAPMFGLAFVACSATTSGLGNEEGTGESESGAETAAETTEDDDGDESGEGEAGTAESTGDETTETTGDGDPTDSDTETDTNAAACGDGIVDPGEECDGDELDGMDCAGLGFLAGELSCSACSFDTAACVNEVCGNGSIEGSEECDGEDLGELDCVALGFGVGTPSCSDACVYDTSVCPSPGEGADCGGWGNECPYDYLACVDDVCYDGSEGDPCNFGWDCQDGLSCEGWDGMCLP